MNTTPTKTQRHISQEEFDSKLEEIVSTMTAASLLSYGGIYEILSEELNNDVIEAWEASTFKERLKDAETAGSLAGRHDATHDGKTENPYSAATEPALHEAWEAEYENEYQACAIWPPS